MPYLLAFLVALSPAADQPAATAAGSAPRTAAAQPEGLAAYVEQQARQGFSGAVLVARGAEVLLEQEATTGAATRPVRAYWLGSLSKQFAAAAVLKLAEQGRLQVQDSLPRFFAAVPADKRRITLHQLLTHTAGLADRYSADGETDFNRAVRAILRQPLSAAPGKGYRYSSDGYALLALAVEKAAGMPYEQYLRTQLLEPAGLRQTGFWGEPLPPDLKLAPVLDEQRTRRVDSRVYRQGQSQANYGYRGATGMYSTARDLLRWISALRGRQLLGEGSLRQLWAPAVPVRREGEREVFYGYGWVVLTRGGQTVELRHSGVEDWLGHNSHLILAGEYTIAVLSNAGDPNGEAWSRKVAEGLQQRLAAP
ncbi:serine hydrolase domain-containing protein [Solirubrum puertoriconensis]|nr:serine hydrolase domain-containing protein [Solirubrum puertoriconensis]